MKDDSTYGHPVTASTKSGSRLHTSWRALALFPLAYSAPAASASDVAAAGSSDIVSGLLIALAIALVVAVLAVIGLVFWGRKQESITDMMLFCMKYLVHSENEAERSSSAKALSRVKDPGALLVLIDVVGDNEESHAVRKAAGEALHEMAQRHRNQAKIIAELEPAIEANDSRAIIKILLQHFEKGKKRFVQSAYLIGRHFLRLGEYVDARDWFRKASLRNSRFDLYGHRIEEMIDTCNQLMLAEANAMFHAGDYHGARQQYAALSKGLGRDGEKRFATFLREACVYCRLKDYKDADQALLQSLEHGHETDLALPLVNLVQKLAVHSDSTSDAVPNREEIEKEIDRHVATIMKRLGTTGAVKQTKSEQVESGGRPSSGPEHRLAS